MYNILFEKKYGRKYQFNVHLIRSEKSELRLANEQFCPTVCSVIKTAGISTNNEKVLSNLNKSLKIEDGLEILHFLCFHEFDLPSDSLISFMQKCAEIL